MGATLTLIMPFYLNGAMLRLHFATWLTWADAVKEAIRIILVDDGSPEPAEAILRPKGLPELSIFRVDEDKPWHQHAARNIGAHEAPEGWMLLTDMDHLLTPENAEALLAALPTLDRKAVHTLDRIEATTGKPTLNELGQPKPHPNSFVMTRELFWKIGGYDEEFCGQYGTDGFFRARAFRKARRGHIEVPLIRYWRDLISDASTTTLPRKEGRDPDAKRRILAAKLTRGEPDVVKVLQTPWRRVL